MGFNELAVLMIPVSMVMGVIAFLVYGEILDGV